MRIRTFLAAGVAAVALVTTFAGPAVASREITVEYVGVIGDAGVLCPDGGLDTPSLGGGCFQVGAADTVLAATIVDDSGLTPSGAISFENAAGELIDTGDGGFTYFCQSGSAPVPAGAVNAFVYVDEAFAAISDCATPGPGTTGTITATIS